MKENKRMSAMEIASKLKARKGFWIATKAEQKEILTAKRFLGLELATRANLLKGGFDVIFL